MANRIKEIRLQHGLTLKQLADRLGVSESTVQRYESGLIKNLKYETMVELAEILGCSPSYLMGWDEAVQNNGQDEVYYLDDEVREIADLASKSPDHRTLFSASKDMTKEDIHFILKMIERMS